MHLILIRKDLSLLALRYIKEDPDTLFYLTNGKPSLLNTLIRKIKSLKDKTATVELSNRETALLKEGLEEYLYEYLPENQKGYDLGLNREKLDSLKKSGIKDPYQFVLDLE